MLSIAVFPLIQTYTVLYVKGLDSLKPLLEILSLTVAAAAVQEERLLLRCAFLIWVSASLQAFQ